MKTQSTKHKAQSARRPVEARFYKDLKVFTIVKTNHSASPNNAVCNALRHMQINQYDAKLVEVFNLDTGKLYAVAMWAKAGQELVIVYQDEIEDYHESQ